MCSGVVGEGRATLAERPEPTMRAKWEISVTYLGST